MILSLGTRRRAAKEGKPNRQAKVSATRVEEQGCRFHRKRNAHEVNHFRGRGRN
jgi:hypothetical protein